MQQTTEEKSAPAAPFKPHVPDEMSLPELTLRAVILGSVAGIIFGVASVYLGLRIGLTTSASVPIAVVALAILQARRKSAILERNMAQTIGSAGESIAAAVVFTLPALIFLVEGMKPATTFLVALLGGLLGVLMMIPLRRYLIVKEHGKLTYPEGTACAQVLVTGEKGGSQARKVFAGGLLGAGYNFCMQVLGLLQTETHQRLRFYKGAEVAGEFSPVLLGVGYIIGYQTSAIMVAGGVMGFLVIIPMISLFGSTAGSPLYPELSTLIGNMEPGTIWSRYLRYIGAGAVATGGLFGLARAMPAIIESFRASVKQLVADRGGSREGLRRTEKDMPISVVVLGSLGLALVMWLVGLVSFFGALLVILFGFFFSVVSSRITGAVGSSSCPISGMTIATLMGTCALFLLLGWEGHRYAASALLIGSIVCIALSNAGTTSQDLKTGFLVGATPVRQQIGLFIGVVTSVAAIGWTMDLMNKSETKIEPKDVPGFRVPAEWLGEEVRHKEETYRLARIHGIDETVPKGFYLATAAGEIRYHKVDGIGGSKFPAPQSRLMELVISGLLERKLPWDLVLIGVAIALFMEILGIHSLTFAVGLYLPLSSTAPIFIGGLVRRIADRAYRKVPDDFQETDGTLYSSGLIAGGALVGVLAAGIRVVSETAGWPLASWLHLGQRFGFNDVGYADEPQYDFPLMRVVTLAAFLLVGWLLFRQARPDKPREA